MLTLFGIQQYKTANNFRLYSLENHRRCLIIASSILATRCRQITYTWSLRPPVWICLLTVDLACWMLGGGGGVTSELSDTLMQLRIIMLNLAPHLTTRTDSRLQVRLTDSSWRSRTGPCMLTGRTVRPACAAGRGLKKTRPRSAFHWLCGSWEVWSLSSWSRLRVFTPSLSGGTQTEGGRERVKRARRADERRVQVSVTSAWEARMHAHINGGTLLRYAVMIGKEKSRMTAAAPLLQLHADHHTLLLSASAS